MVWNCLVLRMLHRLDNGVLAGSAAQWHFDNRPWRPKSFVDVVAAAVVGAISAEHPHSLLIFAFIIEAIKDFPGRTISLAQADLDFARCSNDDEAKARMVWIVLALDLTGAPSVVYLEIEDGIGDVRGGWRREKVLQRYWEKRALAA